MRGRASVRKADSRFSLRFRIGFAVFGGLIIYGAVALIKTDSTPTDSSSSLWTKVLERGERVLNVRIHHHAEGPVIYPYSIVPGGIHSLAELRRAIQSDPVVAAQYARFNLAKFRIIKIRKTEYAYVSYRIGSDVFWTKKRLKLCKGETLITDGEEVFRTRCGNQVSQTAPVNVWTDEPAAAVLDTPASPPVPQNEVFAAVDPGIVTSATDNVPGAPLILSPPTPGESFVSPPPFVGFFTPFVPPLPGCGGRKDCLTRTKPPRPPAPAPENGTLLLLLTGISMVATARWFFKSRSRAAQPR